MLKKKTRGWWRLKIFKAKYIDTRNHPISMWHFFEKNSSKMKVLIRFLLCRYIYIYKCLTTRNSCSSSDVHPWKHPKMSPPKKGPQSKNKGDHLPTTIFQLRLLLVLGNCFSNHCSMWAVIELLVTFHYSGKLLGILIKWLIVIIPTVDGWNWNPKQPPEIYKTP